MYEHKQDVISTRKGCLGGSDAKMLQNIAKSGFVPKSAFKRLAVCKGLIEPEQFTNKAMEMGNYIEACVYKHLCAIDSRWQSNPCLVSAKYSRKNVKCIDHVDFLLKDDESKTLTLAECKATKFTFLQTRHEYAEQLAHHYMLGCELAKQLGNYKVKVYLCHYDTDGIDYDRHDFDTKRLTIKPVRVRRDEYDLVAAMNIVDSFLDDFNEYYEGDEISSEYLPEKVKKEFETITNVLAEIKERERVVEDFKVKLYDFMQEKGIKSIKNDAWAITRVDPTESVSVDYKVLFANEIESKRPRVAKKLKEKYKRVAKRKGYVNIKIKN